MQVRCFSLGPGAPKSSQLGLLRCGCEAFFSPLCKTRKHCKNARIVPFLLLLGLRSKPPHPSLKRGFATNQLLFFWKWAKTSWISNQDVSFWARVAKETATNMCENWFRELLLILWKTTRTTTLTCRYSPLRAKTGNSQNRARGHITWGFLTS